MERVCAAASRRRTHGLAPARAAGVAVAYLQQPGGVAALCSALHERTRVGGEAKKRQLARATPPREAASGPAAASAATLNTEVIAPAARTLLQNVHRHCAEHRGSAYQLSRSRVTGGRSDALHRASWLLDCFDYLARSYRERQD